MSDDLHQEDKALAAMRAVIGTPIGSPSVAPDPVNQPMIRHWVTALEDHNPVYTDPEFAKSSRFGGIVAPPLMLQTWTMATPKISGIAERGGSPVEFSHAGHQLGVRDRALSPAWRGHHLDDGDRVGV